MEPSRAQIISWLKTIMAERQEKPTAWARRAGIAQSTLTRFLANDDAPMLSTRTLSKLAHAANTTPPFEILPSSSPPVSRPAGLEDAEGHHYTAPEDSNLERAILALIGDRETADPWELNTWALSQLGYVPGDIVIVDLGRKAEPGDIVCAQDHQWGRGRTATIFRLYEPPYLVAATTRPELADRLRKPLLVDNDRVIIMGVVTDSVRRPTKA